MTSNSTNGKEFHVYLLTPYLATELPDRMCDFEKFCQVVGGGYEPLFKDVPAIVTPTKKIALWSPDWDGWRRPDIDPQAVARANGRADLIISGSTRAGEREVREMKPTGLLVARFSIFYGGNSGYTGSTPAEAGYSLDIPKSAPLVREMLLDDRVTEALASRDLNEIRKAFEEFNRFQPHPVLLTEFLAEALSIDTKAMTGALP